MRFTLAIGILMLNIFSIPFLASAQTGPGGVGNGTGSGGQPLNRLWLRADAGVFNDAGATAANNNDLLWQWNDQSSNSAYAVQATAGSRPTYLTNVLNGLPVVRFNGTSSELLFGNRIDNTNALPMSFFAVTRGTTNPRGLFDSRPFAGDVFRFYSDGGGDNSVEFWNQSPYKSGLNLSSSGSVVSVLGTRNGSLNRQLDAYVSGSQIGAILTSANTAQVGFVSSRLGTINGGSDGRFNGDIAEVVLFSTAINAPQRIIVENYLGAKYGISLSANDYFANTTYTRDLIGIGTTNGTLKHSSSNAGALLLTESSATLNAANEFVFAGHNGTAHSAVSGSNLGAAAVISAAVTSRWAREYRIEKTGTTDMTIGFDYAQAGMSRVSNTASDYVLLYRASNGCTQYSIATISGSPDVSVANRVSFTITNANLANGFYTLGLKSSIPATTLYTFNTNCSGGCSFETASSWTRDATGATSVSPMVPRNIDNFVVLTGNTVSANNPITINIATINSGGTLDLGTSGCSNMATLNGAGTLRLSASSGTLVFPTITTNNHITTSGSTVEYNSANSFTLPSSPSTYRNLTFSSGGTKTVSSALVVDETFLIQPPTNFTTNSNLNLKGNLVNNGQFNQTGGTTTFGSSVAQSITGSPILTIFNNLTINNSGLGLAGTVSSTIDFTITGNFTSSSNNTTAFNASNGTILINSASAQSIGGIGTGSVNFFNLITASAGIKSINRSFNVSNSLTTNVGSTLQFPAGGTVFTLVLNGFTNNGTFNMAAPGSATTHVLNVSGNMVLNNSSVLNLINGSNVANLNLTRSGAQTISGGTPTSVDLNNLSINSTSQTTLSNFNLNIRGDVSVDGILNLGSQTANRATAGGNFLIGTTGILRIGGTNTFPTNYTTNTLTAGSTVEYNGTNQNITGLAYSNLTTSGGSTKTLVGATTVNGTLNLTNGIVALGANNLLLQVGSSISGTPSSINNILASGTGEIRRYFDAPGSFTFPVGTGSVYTPLTLNISSATFGTPGTNFIGLRSLPVVAPSQLDATFSITKYWATTATNISGVNGALAATYNVAEANIPAESSYGNAYYNGSIWTVGNTSTVSGRVITFTLTGSTMIGNWTAGPNVAFVPASFYSRANGNFESASTWSQVGYGGAVSAIPPTAGSNIFIGDGRTVSFSTGSKSLSVVTIDVTGVLDLGILTGNSINTLNGSGTIRITAPAAGTAVFPTVTTNNFITTSGNTVEYYGPINYNLPAAPATYRRLAFTGVGSTKQVSSVLTVSESLVLNSGLLALGNQNLNIGALANILGTPSASNMILVNGTGSLIKYYDAIGSFTFPFGTTGVYTPATINLTAATFGGVAGTRFISVRPVATAAPNQLDASYSLTKHWVSASTNLSGITANLSFTYTISERNATAEHIYTNAFWNGSAWTTSGSVNSPVISMNRTGVADLNGNFSAGPVVAFTRGIFYSRANGNFEDANSWSLTGFAGAAYGIPPTLGSQIQIGNARTITATAGGKNLSWVIINSGSILDLSSQTGITLDSLKGSGKLRITASSGTAAFPNVTAAKNTFITTIGDTVEYYGLSNYNLPASPATYTNLKIEGAGSTKTQLAAITINTALRLSSGFYGIGNFNLVFAQNGVVTGSPSVNNMIIGNGTGWVQKNLQANGSSFNFPIGTTGAYTPASIVITTATFAGGAASRFVNIRPIALRAPAQLDSTYSITKYWATSLTNISAINGTFTGTYAAAEAFPDAAVEATCIGRHYSSATTTWTTSGTVASRVISFALAASDLWGNWTAGPSVAFAAGTFHSIASGNFETGATWTQSGSYVGIASAIPPTKGSAVNIGNNRNVTATGTKWLTTMTIDGGGTPGTLDLGTSSNLRLTTLNGAGTIRISALSGTAVFPNVTGTNNFISTAGSTVEYYGTSNYNIPAIPTSYQNLTLTGASAKTITISTTVNSNLNLNSGFLDLAGFNLLLPLGSSIVGTPSASTMIRTTGTGVVRRFFNAVGSFTYPIGTTTRYTPAFINVTAATFGIGAYIDVRAIKTVAPNQLDANYSLTKHWAVSSTNLSAINANLSFTYDIAERNATAEPIYVPGYWNGSAWTVGTLPQVVSPVVNFSRTGVANLNGNWTSGPSGAFLPGSYYSMNSGSWETASNWSQVSYSGPVSLIPPTNGSDVYIGNSRNITVGGFTKAIKDLLVESGASLDFQSTTGHTVSNLNGAGLIRLSSPNFLTVTTNNFISTTGSTMEFYGSGSYFIPSVLNNFQNLIISGTGAKFLGTNTTVNLGLTLNGCILDIFNSNLIFSVGSTISGSPGNASNMIKTSGTGVVQKYFDAPGSFNFQIGTGSVYTPYNLSISSANFTGGSGSRFVSVRAVAGLAPSQLDNSYSIAKHWISSATNINTIDGSLTATYAASEANANPAIEALYGSAYYNGSVWATGPTASVVSRVVTFPLAGSTLNGTWTAGPNVGFLPGTFFSFATGNYETASTWSLSAYSGPVSPIPPTNGSNVSIGNNRIVTATLGSKTVPTVTIDGLPNPGTLDIQSLTGFNFNTLTGSGNIRISAASGTAVFPTVVTNNFSSTAGNTVEFYGAGSYNIPALLSNFQNLTISGTGTKTLLANTTVNLVLSQNAGILDIGNFNLILPIGNTLAGNAGSASNMIRTSGTGVIQKYFDVPGSFNFQIGTSSVYTPYYLTIGSANFTGAAGSRFIRVRAVAGMAPSQLDNSYSISKHWITSATNINTINGSATATYAASEANPTAAIEAIYGSAYYNGSAWITGPISSVVSRVISFPLTASNLNGTWTAGPNVGFLPGTFFSFATGNYETASTWSLSAYGGPVSPIPPTIGSNVSIGNNRIVTATAGSKTVPTVTIDGLPNPGTLNIQSFTGFNFTNLNGAGRLQISAPSGTAVFPTVTTNNFIISPGSTVEYTGLTTFTLPAAPLTYRNLSFSGAGNTKTLGGNTIVSENLVLTSGSVQIAGNNLSITGTTTLSGILADNADAGTNTFTGNVLINGTGSISTANNSPFFFGGGITNNGTFSKTGTSAVTFNTASQTINGTNPITLAGNVSILAGIIVTNQNNAILLGNVSIAQNAKLLQAYTAFPTAYTTVNNGLLINTKFNSFAASNNAGNTISSTTGDNLILNRNGAGSLYAVRTTSFTPASTVQILRFDISTSTSAAATSAATILIGTGFVDNNVVHAATARLRVNLGATSGEFTLNYPDGTSTTSANQSGVQTVRMVINTSGATVTYIQPNLANNVTLANNQADVWVGNTRFAAGLALQTAAQAMNQIKLVMDAGSGSITLNNIQVNPLGTINTSALAQTCYQVTPYDGDSILIPFTVPGSVTVATHFNSGNTYNAQLSNAAGSFTSPTTLGTLTTSALSGTIEGIIPANFASGTGYRVRVVSNNPISTANNNGTNFTINQFRIAPAPAQVFTTFGSGSLITASGLNVTAYQWGYYTTFGGSITDLTGRTSSTYTPLGSDFPGVGTYSLVCKMTTSGGCGINYSNFVLIYINCPVTANLVVNGDFSAGNTGFTSQYNYVVDLPVVQNEMWPEQTYAVVDNPRNVHSSFCNLNTPALRSPDSGGNMLVGNAATSGTLNLWTQNIPVLPNRDYVLTFNAASLAGATSSLLFGIYTGCYRTGADISVPFETVNCVWNKYSFQFNSGNNTTIPLSIVNISAQASGNDIAIDDIVIYQCASVISPPFNVANAPVWRGISSDWFNIDNWGTTCSLPTCADDVYIPLMPSNRVYPAINAAEANAKSISILPGARLSVNSGGNLNVCGGFENLGTLTSNTNSSITFSGNSNPTEIKGAISGANKLGSIIINKTNITDTVKLAANAEITSNFTIIRGQFKAKGFSMKVGQDFSNAGTFIHGNNTVEFNGSSNGIVSRTGTGDFYNVLINKTSASNTVTFSPAVTTIQNQLNLTSGIAVTTETNEISVTNSATNSVLNHSANSYVNGRIRRAVSGAGSHDFPVGDATRYQLVNLNATSSLVGTSDILGFFTGTTPGGTLPNLLEDTRLYESVCENGFWTLTPNAQPSAGAYNLTINPVGFFCPGPYQTVGKRANSGAAWTFGGSTAVSATQRDGYTSFSEFAQLDAEEPLPITLVSFFGKWKNQNVELNWTTASEKDNDFFLVERSFDGSTFETIGRVNIKNAVSDANSYRFDDNTPGSGLNVYRLKQFDSDGKFSYSKNITLTRNGAADFVKLLPNPGTLDDAIRIQILACAGEEYKIQIVNMAGKTVNSKLINTQAGLNEVEILSKNQLSQGIYTVHFTGINENASDHLPIKLIIQ